MMDRRTIQSLSDKAAQSAARLHLTPYVVFDEAEVARMGFRFPFLGDHVPEGWDHVDTLFVDTTGLGAANEPALTHPQLQRELTKRLNEKDTFGYAVTEYGQFQAYVGVYRRTGKAAKKVKADKSDVWPRAEG
jgi:hypothetical protein